MPTDVEIHEEVTLSAPNKPNWTLCFQWCTYHYNDASRDDQDGYRFIWRRPDGSLQPARGQARIPSVAEALDLMARAMAAGWGHHSADVK